MSSMLKCFPPRVKARGVQFGMVPPRRSGSALCTIASAILRLVGRNLGRIRWAKHATPREHHRVLEGVEVGAVEYDSQEQHNPLGAAARLP